MKKNTVSILFFSLLFSSSLIIEAKDKKAKTTKVRKGSKRIKTKKGKKSASAVRQVIVERQTDEIITLITEIGKIEALSDEKTKSIFEKIANNIASNILNGYKIDKESIDYLETKKKESPLIEELLTKINSYNLTLYETGKEKNEENIQELISKENSKIVSLKAKATELIAQILKEKLDDSTKSKLENILNLILSNKKVDYEKSKEYFNTKFENMKNTQAVDLLDTIRDYNRQIVIEDLVQSQVKIDKTTKRIQEKEKAEINKKKLEKKAEIKSKIKYDDAIEKDSDKEKLKKFIEKEKERRKAEILNEEVEKLATIEELKNKIKNSKSPEEKAQRKEELKDTIEENKKNSKEKKEGKKKERFEKNQQERKKRAEAKTEELKKENELKEKQNKLREEMINKIDQKEKDRAIRSEVLERKFQEKEQQYLENIMSIAKEQNIVENKGKILENIEKITDIDRLDKLANLFKDVKTENKESLAGTAARLFTLGFAKTEKTIRNTIIDEFLKQIEKQIQKNQ